MTSKKYVAQNRAQTYAHKQKRGVPTDYAAIMTDFIAGWHARGRAERVTKAERAVVEAAKRWGQHPSLDNSAALHVAVGKLERAKGGK